MQIVRLKISIRNKQETEFFDALTSMCTLALNEGIKRRLLQEGVRGADHNMGDEDFTLYDLRSSKILSSSA